MDLTPFQTGTLGVWTQHPDLVDAAALEEMADRLLAPRVGPGRRPSVSYPVLSERQLETRARAERPLGETRVAVYPGADGLFHQTRRRRRHR